MKKALITGVTGQDGSYLAELLLREGYEVHGIVRRGSTINTSRVDHIFPPESTGQLHYGDLADANSIVNLLMKIKPDEVYNIGSMSHVRVSFDIPEYTGQVTGLAATRILEALRSLGMTNVKYYQASSSEMFGASPPPQNEETPFRPQSPYGCAKLYAYWMTRAYRTGYNMFTCQGILFNHECLTAQTPIIVKKDDVIDIVAIEEIVPHREDPRHGIKYSTMANNDLEVWDGDSWTKIKTMTATWNKAGTSSDKKLKRVICRGGYYEATSDHISFIKGGKAVKTSKLKTNDELEIKQLPCLTKKTVTTTEEAEFLGMMVADGYISSDGSGRFINDNKKLREKLASLWHKIAAGNSREEKHPSGFYDGMVFSLELSGNRDYLRMIRREVYNEKNFKKVPKRILNSTPQIIKGFLCGYNNCDGLKAGHQKTEFKSFTTNSSVLAAGLWYLVNNVLNLRITLHPEQRQEKLYFHLNVNSDKRSQKGKHLRRSISGIKNVKSYDYTGWLFDLETESGTFSAGVGLTWVHNSPRRGETFVTKKIVRAAARIKLGLQNKISLGNLKAKRDWGFAGDYVEAIYRIMQHTEPDDFVVATEEYHAVEEFAKRVFDRLGLNFYDHLEVSDRHFRPNEVPELRGDASKIRRVLGWKPKVGFDELIEMMVSEALKEEEENAKNNTSSPGQ